MKITLIVACSANWVIGHNGTIPWHIPEDLKLFKETTMGHCCIMGRTTWDSIPEKFRPLVGRKNIVLTSNPNIPQNEDVICAASLEEAIGIARKNTDKDEIFIIGGASVYNYCLEMNIVDQILISEMKFRVDRRDGLMVHFPELGNDWQRMIINEFDEFEFVKYIPKRRISIDENTANMIFAAMSIVDNEGHAKDHLTHIDRETYDYCEKELIKCLRGKFPNIAQKYGE